jgi:hypothetical protein
MHGRLYEKFNDIDQVEKIPLIGEAFEKFLNYKVNYFEKTKAIINLLSVLLLRQTFILIKKR